MQDNASMALRIAEAVQQAGGRAYYVGGFVRDRLLGLVSKDIDLEIHRVPPETLEGILDSLGERMSYGESFGVMGLRHYDIDIALPRAEEATGRGHRDFRISADPFLGEKKAAMRRDFTVNALMQDVLTGEVLDFFGGQADLEKKCIRHVCDESYGEDPLRAFRAAQFAARFGFSVAEETVALSSRMAVDALAGERVMAELEKALLKAEKPSVFFEVLRRMDQLSVWFPEVEALIGVPQSPVWHPEGDVWAHTMLVADAAAGLRPEAEVPLRLMLAALCHDLGKAVKTTQTGGTIHAYRHECASEGLAGKLLARLTNEKKLTEAVLNMVLLHMEPNRLPVQNSRVKAYMKLYDRALCPEDLLLLCKADYLGCRGPDQDPHAWASSYEERERTLRSMLEVYRRRMAEPSLTGKDLIAAGIEPGPLMGELLRYAHRMQICGVPRKSQLKMLLGTARKLKK